MLEGAIESLRVDLTGAANVDCVTRAGVVAARECDAAPGRAVVGREAILMSEAPATKPKRAWRWPWREPAMWERRALRFAQGFSVYVGFAATAGSIVRLVAPHPTIPPTAFRFMAFIGAILFAYGVSGLARWRISIPLGAAAGLLFAMAIVPFVADAILEPGRLALFPLAFAPATLSVLAFVGMREPIPCWPAANPTLARSGDSMRGEKTFPGKSDQPTFRHERVFP